MKNLVTTFFRITASLSYRMLLAAMATLCLPTVLSAQLTLASVPQASWSLEYPIAKTTLTPFSFNRLSSNTPDHKTTTQQSESLLTSRLWNLPTQFAPTQQPRAYCFRELAFFCKVEVQLEQLSKIPVKFRLGSVDYVDQLESKR